jgi:Ca-activated chloride channel family protein
MEWGIAMGSLEFRDPWFLLLLLLLPFLWRAASRSTSLLQFSSLQLLRGTPASLRQRLARLPAGLLVTAAALLVIALARPRTPQSETRVAKDGIAIMMIVDQSSSMNARDLVEDDQSVDRLDVVKEVFLDFVFGGEAAAGQGRPDDLIGIVTFAGYADSVCPLTLDHGNLRSIVRQLEIVTERGEDGTALGDGLGLGIERLRRSRAKSRVAILLTDGVENAGVIPAVKAAELAAENDIRVYCIGAGTNGMAPVPVRSLFGGISLIGQPVEIDEETLEEIAQKTGGRYFRAENRESLAEIYAEIDALERTEVSEMRYLQYSEHYSVFVLSGMVLIAVASVLSGSVFRRLP